jgi:hypothetical protein
MAEELKIAYKLADRIGFFSDGIFLQAAHRKRCN